ncbi:MAG TPA: hypothetical protein VKD90_30675, partial [Gemmataceae bacterium]|nr:hypothetical protein [Gemmataceae bacterium]
MTRSPLAIGWIFLFAGIAAADPLPGTKSLEDKDDLAAKMVAGIDADLMRRIEAAAKGGNDRWNVKSDSLQSYLDSVRPNRDRLRKLLGAIDERVKPVKMEYVGSDTPSALVAETAGYKVYAVRWPVLPGVDGEGLLLEPTGPVRASVVAIPDADQTPEQIVGLAPGVPAESQFARRLGSTCRVVVPVLIDRKPTSSPSPVLKRDTNIPHREFIWRMAYEMGRHPIGYEVQKVLAAVDWLKSREKAGEVGVFGYGEGGLVALYAGALDPRIEATVVSGVGYGTRGQVWREPIDRSVWASLPEFRDEHLRKLFGGRTLVYEHSHSPKFDLPNPPGYRQQAAAGLLSTPEEIRKEIADADASDRVILKGEADLAKVAGSDWRTMAMPGGQFGHPAVVTRLLVSLNVDTDRQPPEPGKDLRESFDPTARQMRQFNQLVAFTQRLWRVSDQTRKQFLAKADLSSPAAWEKSQEWYRNYFWEEVIGKLPEPTEPLNPRSRELYDTPKWKGYEVMLDLYPDVFAYGILLLPKDLKEGEKRPVVVCQHGLEGKPTDVCNPKERTKYYNSFAAQLADLGYIVYAPQNPYFGHDNFRVLQRKANP